MFVVICFIVASVALISWAWVNGIDYMKENHPDYKGEDFLNSAGRDGWDDTTIYTEGDF